MTILGGRCGKIGSPVTINGKCASLTTICNFLPFSRYHPIQSLLIGSGKCVDTYRIHNHAGNCFTISRPQNSLLKKTHTHTMPASTSYNSTSSGPRSPVVAAAARWILPRSATPTLCTGCYYISNYFSFCSNRP